MSKTLAILWTIAAIVSLMAFFVEHDFDMLLIACLEGFMAYFNYQDMKREESE